MKRKTGKRFFILTVLLFFTAVISLNVGSAQSRIGIGKSLRILLSHLPLFGGMTDTADISAMHDYIIMEVRLPRVVLSGLVGAGLSTAGGVLQGLFGNPLADPHVLGVSSGAAMGATIAICAGISFGASVGAVSVCAFAGALLAMGTVLAVSGGGRHTVLGVLLTGTAVSTLLSAVISLLMSLHHDDAERIYRWTLGSFNAAGWSKTAWTAAISLVGVIVLLCLAGDLNLMAMGEETAQSLGVETRRVRLWILILTSLIVAVDVSVSGTIGFVGLVVPHCMRFLLGSDYRRLIPGCILGGGAFLMLCDTAARTLLAPGELPVGVVTAIIGAPYFICLIRKNVRL